MADAAWAAEALTKSSCGKDAQRTAGLMTITIRHKPVAAGLSDKDDGNRSILLDLLP
jgi:hypothetical protein